MAVAPSGRLPSSATKGAVRFNLQNYEWDFLTVRTCSSQPDVHNATSDDQQCTVICALYSLHRSIDIRTHHSCGVQRHMENCLTQLLSLACRVRHKPPALVLRTKNFWLLVGLSQSFIKSLLYIKGELLFSSVEPVEVKGSNLMFRPWLCYWSKLQHILAQWMFEGNFWFVPDFPKSTVFFV